MCIEFYKENNLFDFNTLRTPIIMLNLCKTGRINTYSEIKSEILGFVYLEIKQIIT